MIFHGKRAFAPALLAVTLAVLGAGCGGKAQLNREWQTQAGVQVLRLRWVKLLTPENPNFLIPELVEEHDRFDPVETSSAGFDGDRRRAFVGASVGGLYCLDLYSGETVWRFGIDDAVGSTPIYDPNRKYVYFGADDGAFYAVHARSGRLVWRTVTGGEVRRPAVLHEDTLYVVNADSTVFAIEPERGEVIWQYRRLPVEGFAGAGHGGIAFQGDRLVVGFSDGYVAALDAVSGSEIWTRDLAAEVTAVTKEGVVELMDADATPAVIGNVVVAASVAGGLEGLDLSSGKVLWTRSEIKGTTGLATAEGMVFAARTAFGLSAVDPGTGRVLWSRQFETGVLQDPVVHDDVLLIADSVFGLFVVSTLDGRLLQRLDQREGFFAPPSIHAGYALILGNNGHLFTMSIL